MSKAKFLHVVAIVKSADGKFGGIPLEIVGIPLNIDGIH